MPQPDIDRLQRIADPPPLPPRPADGHKGLFGKLLVVGGSAAMLGAPVLAGTAALRLGSGLVQIAVPAALVPFALSITPELTSLPLPETSGRKLLTAAAGTCDALVVGPGLGTGWAARKRVAALVAVGKPMVLDADALNILAAGDRWPADVRAAAVLTPHPGEMARLAKLLGKGDVPERDRVPTDEPGRIALAAEAATTFGQVVLLKGHRTVVTDGARVYVNATGNSALSKGGTGDVLSGMIGSLVGQGMTPFDAACRGAWLHGRAGEIAGERLGLRCVLARDVIEAIADAVGDR